ncbi:hypothetical protein IGS68_11710 [Skermanella sp. TT6]|uniref:ElaB/YqjD/DUF883 family membrane-anchored ribosome-binding protein n=1 Tax=Skermanella cutis TaxID=2775420 RepID=A0ABX7BBQ2_9PROT|nr:hypothetical protein [Skermanella sp. TT6]QQP91822.1 hypothetical protein IGS68_11710 [Skermanella sp. TT6]
MDLDWNSIELNWGKYKELVREKWRRIPQEIIDDLQGSRDRLIDAISESYDVTREQALRELSDWAADLRERAGVQAERAARARAEAAAAIRRLADQTSGQAAARSAAGQRRLAELRAVAEHGRDRAVARAQRRVRSQPGAALLIAFGIGMLLGGFVGRRR